MIIPNVPCESCKQLHTVKLEPLCWPCVGKILTAAKVEKHSKWKEIKKFSWFALFLLPITTFIGCKYGYKTQWVFDAGFLASPILSILTDYCSRKF